MNYLHELTAYIEGEISGEHLKHFSFLDAILIEPLLLYADNCVNFLYPLILNKVV